MLSLRPDALLGEDPPLEEFFLGVAMRRYIDPDWTTGARVTARHLDGERCWWVEPPTLKRAPTFRPRTLIEYTVDGEAHPLLNFHRRNQIVEITAAKRAIDGVGGTRANWVTIAKVDEKHFSELAILHQPVAPGRYSASVLMRTRAANTERGEVNTPLMLASFEWSPPTVTVKDANGTEKKRTPPTATLSTPRGNLVARCLPSGWRPRSASM